MQEPFVFGHVRCKEDELVVRACNFRAQLID